MYSYSLVSSNWEPPGRYNTWSATVVTAHRRTPEAGMEFTSSEKTWLVVDCLASHLLLDMCEK